MIWARKLAERARKRAEKEKKRREKTERHLVEQSEEKRKVEVGSREGETDDTDDREARMQRATRKRKIMTRISMAWRYIWLEDSRWVPAKRTVYRVAEKAKTLTLTSERKEEVILVLDDGKEHKWTERTETGTNEEGRVGRDRCIVVSAQEEGFGKHESDDDEENFLSSEIAATHRAEQGYIER